MFYGYLNLESTKTQFVKLRTNDEFYGYLNLESTKTPKKNGDIGKSFTVT